MRKSDSYCLVREARSALKSDCSEEARLTVERRCGTCRHFRSSAMRGLGWCVHPQMRASNERTFVDKNEFACNRQHFDYWQPNENSVRIGSFSIPLAGSRLVMVAAGGAASLVVLLCVLTFAVSALAQGNRGLATAVPTPTVAAAAPTAPAAAPTAAPSKLKIGNTDGFGACIRADAAVTAGCVRAWPDGTVLDVVGADKTVEGKPWRNVKDTQGNAGWILSDYLLPAE